MRSEKKQTKSFFNRLVSLILLSANYFVVILLLLSYISVYINPLDFWIFAFFGLAYPVFLILNLGFVIFWLLNRKKIFFLSLFAILIGWTHLSNTIQISFSAKEQLKPANSFSFMSYNVRLFNFYKWIKEPGTNVRILELINNQNADIICIQEYVYIPGGLINRHPESKKLHERYSHIAYSDIKPRNRNFGIATFSRFPIVEKGTIRFKNTSNISIYTDILIRNDTVRVFNNHLQSIEISGSLNHFMDSITYTTDKYRGLKDMFRSLKNAFIQRSYQLQKLMEHIEKSPHPVIIAGDLNETPVSFTYHSLRRNLQDAFVISGSGIGATYISQIPFLRIDYLLHDKLLGSFQFRKIPVVLSDHFPVKAHFYFRNSPTD